MVYVWKPGSLKMFRNPKKSKTGVSVAQQKGLMSSKFYLKKENVQLCFTFYINKIYLLKNYDHIPSLKKKNKSMFTWNQKPKKQNTIKKL